jgi:MurNAc alpha-1-phosphate uridylyltransferase
MKLKTAMILAAGRGERLQPLTNTTPKPLLIVGGKPLIVHHLEQLRALKFEKVVINVHHLADQLMGVLGDGKQFGLNIIYSEESQLLGAGGSVRQALDLIGAEPFLLISGDIYTSFPFEKFVSDDWTLDHCLIHAVLTDKHAGQKGDVNLSAGQLSFGAELQYIYASIAVINPELFQTQPLGYATLMPALNKAVTEQRARGEYYQEVLNVNTLDEYRALVERVG